MRKIIILMLITLASNYAFSQIMTREIKQLDNKKKNKLHFEKKGKEVKLPKFDYSKLKQQEVAIDQPFEFGKAHNVNIGLKDGEWFEEENKNIWKLKISSSGAYSINLIFKELKLVDQAELFIYNEDKTIIMGPIDQHNSKFKD